MRLIDADNLEPDIEWSKFYDEFMAYSQRQIRNAEEVKAIPLDKVKKAREEMTEDFDEYCANHDDGSTYNSFHKGIKFCLEIMDKLIESEE